MKKTKKNENKATPKIVIEEVDGTLLRRVTGAGPGGASGAPNSNQCACACEPLNDY